MPTHKLAAHINSYELITCRKRTAEEEKAYMAALPVHKPWVDPASLVDISMKVVRKVNKRMKDRDCTRARACHECGCTVGQYNRAVKKAEAEK